MCAINGKYHLQFIFDVYSSVVESLSKEDFEEIVREKILALEMKLNDSSFRVHVSEQEVYHPNNI